MLAMIVALSSVTVLETKMSQKTKSSVGAFYNADSGVEWALNKIASVSGKSSIAAEFGDSTPGDGIAPSGVTEYKIYLLNSQGQVIKDGTELISNIKAVRAVGTQNTGEVTQRAIEAAVAAAGSPTFTKCQVKLSSTAIYPICPLGWIDIHHYASASIGNERMGTGGAVGGMRPVNMNDDGWDYQNSSRSVNATLACAVCQKN
jgi:hypothetical protein